MAETGLEQGRAVAQPAFRNARLRRENTRSAFTRYGWYAVLGILAVVIGATLGLALG
jgi:hypothetical protein